MSPLFATLLSAHILLGVIGVSASVVAAYCLIRPKIDALPLRAAWIATLSYILSWLSGGWYYWKFYGASVKPAILENTPWAHLIFMEAKEHVFLFLPFAALVFSLVLYTHKEALISDDTLRKQTLFLALAIAGIAVIITLSGVLISGGSR